MNENRPGLYLVRTVSAAQHDRAVIVTAFAGCFGAALILFLASATIGWGWIELNWYGLALLVALALLLARSARVTWDYRHPARAERRMVRQAARREHRKHRGEEDTTGGPGEMGTATPAVTS